MKLSIQILLTLPLLAVALEPKPLADELFSVLAENGIDDISPEKTAVFQQFILNALQEGSEKIAGLEITSAKEESHQTGGVADMLDTSMAAQLSIRFLDGDLKECLDGLAKLLEEKKAKALLIEFRESGGDDENAAKQLVDFCKECKVPIGVLVDGGTHAMAEAILPELKAAGATVLGSPTAGRPGPRKSVKLSNGTILHIPQKKSAPIVPDVALQEDVSWKPLAADFVIAKGVLMAQ